MLYRKELPSNITTLLALFGGGLRIELSCRRAAVFGAWHVFIIIEFSGLVILDYREIKDSVLPTDWMVFISLRLE